MPLPLKVPDENSREMNSSLPKSLFAMASVVQGAANMHCFDKGPAQDHQKLVFAVIDQHCVTQKDVGIKLMFSD
jgi:hypothetical protein